jgi:hypothetical protein
MLVDTWMRKDILIRAKTEMSIILLSNENDPCHKVARNLAECYIDGVVFYGWCNLQAIQLDI